MLPYARRIVFDDYRETYCRPNRIVFVESKPKSLLNEKGQFCVEIDEKNPYVKELVKKAQNLGLTVSGDGTAPVKGGDIRQAQNGDFLTFGTSSRFDMNWITRTGYLCEKGYRPVYTLSKDWNKINNALNEFADKKNNFRLSDGTDIRFHSRFCVINGRVRTYENNEIAVVVPAQILERMVVELGILNVRFIL